MEECNIITRENCNESGGSGGTIGTPEQFTNSITDNLSGGLLTPMIVAIGIGMITRGFKK